MKSPDRAQGPPGRLQVPSTIQTTAKLRILFKSWDCTTSPTMWKSLLPIEKKHRNIIPAKLIPRKRIGKRRLVKWQRSPGRTKPCEIPNNSKSGKKSPNLTMNHRVSFMIVFLAEEVGLHVSIEAQNHPPMTRMTTIRSLATTNATSIVL